ncbi:MAG TPA: CheR family methyltransferase [Leptospiraceae bacterium]|nr:CheR family methyltransferase [Leptospiraceae bacterium]HMY67655.1 CheR family methyltransferase [Leptospiraceae bacterium]HMZ58502.1 CheR family methyltransferase [Leptospiraceae bacterium]HNM05032.1 CheR family methyltransferase [Leptospiraceae bacterium]HNN03912.1 CheR family methyltransferase [Leptospiraceae bacterium]
MSSDTADECRKELILLIEKKLGITLEKLHFDVFLQSLSAKSQLFKKGNLKKESIQQLASENPANSSEWQAVLDSLNITETYFFRDLGQIDLLKNKLLPELISRRSKEKKLDIWCAACSTGEEPYTVSILLHEILPGISSWNIKILGTDINRESLKKAEAGIYSSWSFRGLSSDMQNRFFRESRNTFEVIPACRQSVSFRQENILESPYRDRYDLIICRNMFIYFSESSRMKGMEVLEKGLRNSGFLLIGHSEIISYNSTSLKTRQYRDLFYYEKEESSISQKQPEISGMSFASDRKMTENIAKTMPERDSLSHLNKNTASEIKFLADSGRLKDALDVTESYLDFDKKNAEIYFIRGQIFEAMNNFREAVSSYQKAIDTNGAYLESYLALASLYFIRNSPEESERVRKKALDYIRMYPEISSMYAGKGYEISALQDFLEGKIHLWI